MMSWEWCPSPVVKYPYSDSTQKIVSIEDEPLADDNKITILPNPVGDVDREHGLRPDDGQVNIRVSDITGKTIMRRDHVRRAADQLDPQRQPPG